jgi:diguanylate cyclase (GGDEF)-like protein
MPPPAPLYSEKLARLSLSGKDEEPINLLLVEDSRTVRAQLRQYLSLLDNVTLFEASTLADARAILDQHATDMFCAILDLTLPDASGLDTVEVVRTYGVPIIVLTGSVDEKLRQAVLDLRVIDYMFKNGAAAIEDIAYLIGRLRQNQSMQVMIVDDSATFRKHVTGLLAQYRFPILTAENGRDALALLEQHPDVSLILTDYQMPEMNGLELIRCIRRQYRRQDLSIIALSATHHTEISPAMLKAGANDYLNKGFSTEEFFCRVVQNTNMVRLVRELRDLVNRDYLTRLHNRRYLFEQADALYAEARAGKHALVVAMIDADHFKRVNDQFGHAAGDAALKHIAQILRWHFAKTTIMARYGGEEFVCVMPMPTTESAQPYFEMLRTEVAENPVPWNGSTIPLTVSIGFTTTLGASFADMVELADQAVYRAKAAGRNRVIDHAEAASS